MCKSPTDAVMCVMHVYRSHGHVHVCYICVKVSGTRSCVLCMYTNPMDALMCVMYMYRSHGRVHVCYVCVQISRTRSRVLCMCTSLTDAFMCGMYPFSKLSVEIRRHLSRYGFVDRIMAAYRQITRYSETNVLLRQVTDEGLPSPKQRRLRRTVHRSIQADYQLPELSEVET